MDLNNRIEYFVAVFFDFHDLPDTRPLEEETRRVDVSCGLEATSSMGAIFW